MQVDLLLLSPIHRLGDRLCCRMVIGLSASIGQRRPQHLPLVVGRRKARRDGIECLRHVFGVVSVERQTGMC